MISLQKDRLVIAALIAGSIVLVVYSEVTLRNDPHQLATSFDRAAKGLVARTVELEHAARPSYQDEAIAALAPNALNGPTFRLDDLRGAARSETSSRWLGIPPAAVELFDAEFDGSDPVSFRSARGASTLEELDGVLHVANSGADHLETTAPLAVPADAVREIDIRIRSDRGNRLALSWATSGEVQRTNGIEIDLVSDGEFHTYSINAEAIFARAVEPGGRLTALYLIPSNQVGANVEIDFVRLVSRLDRYSDAPYGATRESLGGNLRTALYMLPTQQLVYSIPVPESSPVLRFGMGVLIDGQPVRFEVLAVAPDGSERVFEQVIDSAERWHDAQVDLSKWAGREIELALRVSGSAQNIAFWSSPVVDSAPRERLNVIVILEDGVRADRLSAQGYWRGTTPNRTAILDDGGIVFTHAFSQATKTRPSIASLMTSLLPTATGVWGMGDRLDEAYLTGAEILRSQGFHTAAFIQNANAGAYAGIDQGFDELVGHEAIGNDSEQVLGGPVLEWLAEHADRNFFLYLHVLDPHAPYDPPAPFDHGFRKLPPVGPAVPRDPLRDPAWFERPTIEARQRLYEGEIRHNDSLLPGLIDELDALGLREDTLLVLTSDHGEFLGDQGYWGHRPPGLLPTIHVPLMLVYPKRFSDRHEIEESVQLLDVVPTILEFAGVDPAGLLLQGDSLVDLIDGERGRHFEERIVVSEEPATFLGQPTPSGSFFFRDWHMIWSRTFKVRQLASRGGADETGPRIFEFHDDLAEDEPRDSLPQSLSSRYWQTVRELQTANAAIRTELLRDGDEPVLRVDTTEAEMLRDLGYVQ